MSSLSSGNPPDSLRLLLSAEQVADLFPFHILFNRKFEIVQVGRSLIRVFPEIRPGTLLTSSFAVERPQISSIQDILHHSHDLFLFSSPDRRIRLRGQMVPLPDGEQFVFLCSPWLPEPGSIRAAGVELRDFPLHDSMPELVQVIQTHHLTTTDLRKLTERLRGQRKELADANEQLLRQVQENQKLALIASNTHNAVVVTDAQGRVEWVNDAFTSMTGYTLEEMRGKTPGSVLQGPETEGSAVEAIREQLRGGKGFTCELLNYAKDGRKYWVAIEVQPIYDKAGKLTNFMAIQGDVTARKRDEARRILGHKVTSLLAEATGSDETITAILETICRAIGADFASIWRIDQELHVLRCRTTWCDNPEIDRIFRDPSLDTVMQPGFGLPGMIWETNEPRWIPELAQEARFIRAEAAKKAGLRVGFGFPTRVNGAFSGVIEFFASSMEQPDPESVELMSQLGNQIGMFLDRREAEAALRSSETYLSNALQLAKAGRWEYDVASDCFTFNEPFYRIFRTTARDVGGSRLSSSDYARRFVHPDDLPVVADEIRAALTTTDPDYSRQLEHKFLYPDGSVGHLAVRFVIVKDSKGNTVRLYGVNQDITELKQAEASLRESEERYRRVMQSATDTILTVDERGLIVFASRSAERLFGYPSETLRGMLVWRLVPPELRSKEALAQAKRNSGRRSWESIEVAALRSDGTRVPVEISLHRSRIGKRVFMTGILRDISERKADQLRLVDAMQEAERANQAKTDFLAHVSHEIRTPLNSVIGMTELLLDNKLDRDQREMLNTVWASSESLFHLINDILDLSKIEAGGVDLDDSEFDPGEICETAIEITAPRARRKALDLIFYTDPSQAPKLRGDGIRIRQILVNLLSNATKFTETGLVGLQMTWELLPGGMVACDYRVEDTGIGVPENLRDHIFEKFFRVDTATGRKAGGAGLGLSISRRLAEAMGGTLTYQPGAKGGSIFRLRLTLRVSGEPCKEATRKSGLLLASEERSDWLRQVLESSGVDLREVRTVDDACLELIGDHPPDVLIVDGRNKLDAESGRKLSRMLSIQPQVHPFCIESIGMRTGTENLGSLIPQPITVKRVRLSLGLDGGPEAATEEKSERETNRPRAGASVLLAEDNPESMIYARRVLEQAGHRVTPATTGEEAIDAARAGHFDVIFMDVMLPDMTGFEVTAQLRALEASLGKRRTPIIALTAHALTEYRQQAFQADMDGYLTKPVRKGTLLNAVSSWRTQQIGVLLVTDDPGAEQFLKGALAGTEDFQLWTAPDAAAAERIASQQTVRVALIQLPEQEAETTLRTLRVTLPEKPILGVSVDWDTQTCRAWMKAGGGALLRSPLRRETVLEALRSAASFSKPSVETEDVRISGEEPVPVDPELADLIPDYLHKIQAVVEQIHGNAAAGEQERIRAIGHNLKGSGSAYGFQQITRYGKEIESAAQSNNLAAATRLAQELSAYLATVRWTARS